MNLSSGFYKLRRKLSKFVLKKLNWKLAKRHSNPYATHLPILVGIGHLFTIKNIIEFGCGENSTLIFLNKTIYPQLEAILSLENDPVWLEKIRLKANADSRISMKLVRGEMHIVVTDHQVDSYDLIFIDDSLSIAQRSQTIKAIALQAPSRSMVIIHDYEQRAYQEAARTFKNRFNFTAFNPNTGIVWNDQKIDKKRLVALNRLLKSNALQVQPDNIAFWKSIIHSKLGETPL